MLLIVFCFSNEEMAQGLEVHCVATIIKLIELLEHQFTDLLASKGCCDGLSLSFISVI